MDLGILWCFDLVLLSFLPCFLILKYGLTLSTSKVEGSDFVARIYTVHPWPLFPYFPHPLFPLCSCLSSLILSLSAEVSPKNIQVQLFLASLPQRTEGQNGEAHLFNFPGKRKAETLRSWSETFWIYLCFSLRTPNSFWETTVTLCDLNVIL